MLAVEWTRESRRILLPILILPPEPARELTSVQCTALLDTGSTSSGIARSVAQQLGLDRLGKRPLGSAHGEAQVERYLFQVGIMPSSEREAPRLPYVFEAVIGFELTNVFQFDALLGMDVLGRCDFAMYRNGRCRLELG